MSTTAPWPVYGSWVAGADGSSAEATPPAAAWQSIVRRDGLLTW